MNENYPKNIAIIMDGNGRWAKARGLPRLMGHRAGAEAVERTLLAMPKFGIESVTLYAFSVENWTRPEAEVSGLMKLLGLFLESKEKLLHENKTRLRIMGRVSDLPKGLQEKLALIEERTAVYSERTLAVCLSYGGRTEIANAARRIAEEVAAGTLRPEDVDESAIASRLYLNDFPDPDLIIRTSGERRLSNFLLWQCAYAEFLAMPVLWPDFSEQHLVEAFEDFSKRKRRYGGVVDKQGVAR